MAAFEAPYVIKPHGEHQQTIIMVHGRGSCGEDFAEEIFEGKTSRGLSLLETFRENTKWVFPSARERFSTVFQEEMNEWFDIYSLSNPNDEQERQKEGLKEAVQYISSLIDAEIEGSILPRNIFLLGISQGFATCCHVLLSQKHHLGGFIGISGWCPFSDHLRALKVDDLETYKAFYSLLDLKAATTASTLQTPVLVSHASDDNVVDVSLGVQATETLKSVGFETRWCQYEEGVHWVNEPFGLDDIAAFLSRHGAVSE